jgi:adenylylsulfate kinase
VHAWNRTHLPGYAEVFLDVPLEELRRRDPKGVYRGGADVVGVDLAAELPLAPDLAIANHGAVSAEAAAARVFAHCLGRKLW